MSETGSRIVVVTGGARGIGRSVALRFAEKDTKVIIIHRGPNEIPAREVQGEIILRDAECERHMLDVSSFEAVENIFKDIVSRYGKIDILVNNAGITRDKIFMRMTEDDWNEVIKTNLNSVFNCSKAVIKSMMKNRCGRIVNISSVVGQMGNAGQANYAASKAGIIGFTKALAREVASRNITVNAVAPGYISTEMTDSLTDDIKGEFIKMIPLGRLGDPGDVAEAVYWLCSNGARYVTGQVINVSGGMYM